MAIRAAEDHLREQYFRLLPEMTRIAGQIKTEIDYSLLPIARSLGHHENLIVKVRVKDCVSAIDKLRRGQPGSIFYPSLTETYSLLSLRDLVGARVLAFPPRRAVEVDERLRGAFSQWQPDPILDEDGEQLAFKYNGSYEASPIVCEYQVVSALIGLFWEVEHAAIYKAAPETKGLSPLMQNQRSAVYQALKAFETDFEQLLRQSEQDSSNHK